MRKVTPKLLERREDRAAALLEGSQHWRPLSPPSLMPDKREKSIALKAVGATRTTRMRQSRFPSRNEQLLNSVGSRHIPAGFIRRIWNSIRVHFSNGTLLHFPITLYSLKVFMHFFNFMANEILNLLAIRKITLISASSALSSASITRCSNSESLKRKEKKEIVTIWTAMKRTTNFPLIFSILPSHRWRREHSTLRRTNWVAENSN